MVHLWILHVCHGIILALLIINARLTFANLCPTFLHHVNHLFYPSCGVRPLFCASRGRKQRGRAELFSQTASCFVAVTSFFNKAEVWFGDSTIEKRDTTFRNEKRLSGRF